MTRADRLVLAALGGLLALYWAFAFVGLSSSSFWTDELFTLFVTDHHAGLGEVLRRALTDTHPPAYYLLLHLWLQVAGSSEAAVRGFSAVAAVLAGVVFVVGGRAAFSAPARLFGALLGASSPWWFAQSQNGRNYALAMLLGMSLLMLLMEAKRRADLGRRVDLWLAGLIAGTGFVAAFVHFYLLLQVGALYLVALLTIRDTRFRLLMLGAGAATLGAAIGYVVELRQHTQQDFGRLWFSNSPEALRRALHGAAKAMLGGWPKAALAFGLLALLIARVRGARQAQARPLADWTAAASLAAILAPALIGLAVSLLYTPSFSDLNLLVAEPCLWPLGAWLYDGVVGGAGPRPRAILAGIGVAALALEASVLDGRLHPRNEEWRESARLLDGQAACRGRDIPVLLPDRFGPATPFYRRLAERDFFGRYYRGGGRLLAWTPAELAGDGNPALSRLLIARARGSDPCPVLAWGVHDLDRPRAEALAQALSRRVGAPVHLRPVPSFARRKGRWQADGPSGFLFERSRPT